MYIQKKNQNTFRKLPKQIEKELEAQISMDSDNKENSKDTLTVFNKDNTLEEEENGKIKEDNEEKEKKIIEEDAQKGQNGGNLIIITMEKKEEPNQITNPINNTIKKDSNTNTEILKELSLLNTLLVIL